MSNRDETYNVQSEFTFRFALNVLCFGLYSSISQALMDILDVPSVLFIPGHLCATFPFNTENALVVDVGYKEVQLLPVCLYDKF